MNDLLLFIDISTLFELNYTGIPNVNYKLVQYFFENFKERIYFFHCERVVKREIIAELLKRKTGKGLVALHNTQEMYEADINSVLRNKNCSSVGIFSNIKTIRKKFDYEVQIIYDLTFLLTPELHHEDTIKWHATSIERDIATDNLCVCISESTKEDLVNYLQFSEEKALVSYLGFEHDVIDEHIYKNILSKYLVEKFVVVIGTIEPRKNVNMILKFLEQNPNVLNQYKFVFLGRDGWGKTFKEILTQFNLAEPIKKERIKHFGYVTEEEKNILLMTAEFLIYSSVYEGFGLPVLEALSLGCPVLTSMTSSIPEVGEYAVAYFDPYDLQSFEKSFFQLSFDLNKRRQEIVSAGLAQAKKFTWDGFVEKIIQRIKSDLKSKI